MNLKELREKKGMQAVNIYRPLKIPRNTWHCYEDGRNLLPLHLIIPIANVMNEPADIIIVCALESRNEYQIKKHPERVIDTWKEHNSGNDAETND